MPHPLDCPCCGEQGLVKDGICMTCGWGDLDHVALARAYWDDRLRPALEAIRDTPGWTIADAQRTAAAALAEA